MVSNEIPQGNTKSRKRRLWGEPCKVGMETKRDKSKKKQIRRNNQGQRKEENLKSMASWGPKKKEKTSCVKCGREFRRMGAGIAQVASGADLGLQVKR